MYVTYIPYTHANIASSIFYLFHTILGTDTAHYEDNVVNVIRDNSIIFCII